MADQPTFKRVKWDEGRGNIRKRLVPSNWILTQKGKKYVAWPGVKDVTKLLEKCADPEKEWKFFPILWISQNCYETPHDDEYISSTDTEAKNKVENAKRERKRKVAEDEIEDIESGLRKQISSAKKSRIEKPKTPPAPASLFGKTCNKPTRKTPSAMTSKDKPRTPPPPFSLSGKSAESRRESASMPVVVSDTNRRKTGKGMPPTKDLLQHNSEPLSPSPSQESEHSSYTPSSETENDEDGDENSSLQSSQRGMGSESETAFEDLGKDEIISMDPGLFQWKIFNLLLELKDDIKRYAERVEGVVAIQSGTTIADGRRVLPGPCENKDEVDKLEESLKDPTNRKSVLAILKRAKGTTPYKMATQVMKLVLTDEAAQFYNISGTGLLHRLKFQDLNIYPLIKEAVCASFPLEAKVAGQRAHDSMTEYLRTTKQRLKKKPEQVVPE